MIRALSTNWEKTNTSKVLVGKPERKRPLERPNLDGRVKMDLKRDRLG
jgi:hypothetical protein